MKSKYIKSKYINFIGGPSCGKSLISALTFVELKRRHLNAEMVQEYAKMLIYKEEYEMLNCQWMVSFEQYKMLKALNNKVEYICCDSPLFLGLFYNRYHPRNICDVKKTEEMIKEKMYELNRNIYIFLERNDKYPFEKEGRIHGEDESKMIDVLMKNILDEVGIEYISVKSDISSVDKIIQYILKKGDELDNN